MLYVGNRTVWGALLIAIVASFLFSPSILAIDVEIEQAVLTGYWERVARLCKSQDSKKDPIASQLLAISCFATNCSEMRLISLTQTPDESVQSEFRIWCQALREKSPENANVAFVNGVANLSPALIDSALLSFDKAFKLDSQFALALAGRGFAQLMYQSDPESAQNSFAESIAIDSTLALAHLGYGMANLYSGNHESAISDFENALTIESSFLDARLCKGVALVHLDRLDDARNLFDEILGENKSGLHKLYAARGDVFSARGLHRSAIWDYTAALAHFEPDIEKHMKRGPLYFERGGDVDQMNEYGTEYNRNQPYFDAYINVFVSRGACYRESQVFDSAISDFSHSLELLTDLQSIHDKFRGFFDKRTVSTKVPFIARILLQRGMTYYAKGDYKKGGSDFGKVIKEDPEAPFAYYWKGLCLKERGKKKKAKRTFNKFIDKAKESDSLLVAKAKSHIAEIENK